MKLLKILTISATASITLAGCVSTNTISTTQINDKDLTCDSIATRIGEVTAAKNFAKAKRGASTENITAALFFWPALLANNSNTSQMINSMDARATTLTSLYNEKSCADEIPTYTNAEIREKIKTKNTLEPFS